jgi:hypothetical protein
MEVEQDFRELLASFNAGGVEYVIVGAHALAHHGAPRFTGDMDVFVCPEAANAVRVVAALEEFGFGSVGLTADDFSEPDQIVQLGYPPVRIDLITSLTGITWDQVDRGKVAGEYGDVSVHYIGRAEYVANKRAAGRKKDLADLEALGED